MKKPLVRYTIGNCSDLGIVCLEKSINKFVKLYNVDVVICYNNLKKEQINKINKFGFKLIKQNSNFLPFKPNECAWKVYPPRLSLDTPELFIDNDLIIHKKIDKIQQFFDTEGSFLSYEEIHKNQGALGNFKELVKKDFHQNGGIYGFPANFDLKSEIMKWLEWNGGWKHYFDEQGLMAKIIGDQSNIIQITIQEIDMCSYGIFNKHAFGHHFTGLNRNDFIAWDKFLENSSPKIKFI